MKAIAGFVALGCLLGLALGMAIRPQVDVVETFNDGFRDALCAPTPDNPAIWQDGAGTICIPQ
ncbi:hypothetical protein ACFV0H_28375 [Streptomyces erythrochromogenes]|uniref:hypothetical protein n=1 Tax=Streptomyces erythrochromogenes TaxID=285574 RepID=UPI00367D03B8